MKHLLFLTFILSLCLSCSDPEEETCIPLSAECLLDSELSISEKNCSFEEATVDTSIREYLYLGEGKLSNNAKETFVDYCNGLYSTISFTNESGDVLNSKIVEKDYRTFTYTGQRGIIDRCYDGELAEIKLSSERFTLTLQLVAHHNEDFIDNNNLENIKVSSYFARASTPTDNGSTRQVILEYPFEDYQNNLIVPDTINIRYHDLITLNGTQFTGLYSNENRVINGYDRKELIYFHRLNGLIALRDSLGTLWVKS